MYKGILYVLIASIFWGTGGVAGQFLYTHYTTDPFWLVLMRQLITGTCFLLYSHFLVKENILAILRQDWLQLLIFSIFGLQAAQLGYYYGISLSNAATTTVIQYTAPIYIVIWMAYKNHKAPTLKELLAIVLAFSGVFLISTHGSFDSLALSPLAFWVATISAWGYVVYSVQPVNMLKRYRNTTVLGWSHLICSASLLPLARPWNYPVGWDASAVMALLYLIVGSTILTFFLYTKGLVLIGPTKASLISCAEPLSSLISMVLVLGTPLLVLDVIGMLSIILAVIIISWPTEKQPA